MRFSAALVLALAFQVGALALMGADPAHAYFDPPSLEGLIAASDVIVLAKVEKTAGTNDGRTAHAAVIESLKGNPGKSVDFGASAAWACDTSAAQVGETVVLFLEHSPTGSDYVIAAAGRGRMRVQDSNGSMVVLLGEVRLLGQAQVVGDVAVEAALIESISLDDLRQRVRSMSTH